MGYQTTYLKDYRKPDYRISEVDLTFELGEERAIVRSKLSLFRELEDAKDLVLHGVDLELVSVTVNGDKASYECGKDTLTIFDVPESATIEIENTIAPAANTCLEGLYLSSGIFCTQNEPHGFRRITYFLDRPDVMAVYTTKIIADKKKYPILLSNGNNIESGDLSEGKHYAVWNDPFPKPSYLFALVAGDLSSIADTFTTRSGREVALLIYSEEKYLHRLGHAMDSLKKSMKWDEDVFGLEYDLDIFMIVAVDSFNAGAMENKGLNIFNTSCLLADPKTETDENFMRVQGVVAHEYFHNWTGDRVTCRDWFQLTLKEGLTVFRDHEFLSDMNERSVKRIKDVVALRHRQFVEDSGPTSHPIKPDSYIEINNFYTATVYEKGSEVIRMIHTLIGKEGFRKGMDTYFSLFDGQAVTTEDFVYAMEKGSGKDLSQFRLWYHQKGTPELEVSTEYDPATKTAYIHVRQLHLDERGQKPFFMPFSVALFSSEGKCLSEKILEISRRDQSFTFENIESKPLFSLNREFSAPVILHSDQTEGEYAKIMAFETDEFSKWEAGQRIAALRMHKAIKERIFDGSEIVSKSYLDAFEAILDDESLGLSFKALALAPPSETELALAYDVIDFDAIHSVREAMLHTISTHFRDKIYALYKGLHIEEKYSPDPQQVGKRQLRLLLLSLIRRLGDIDTVYAHFKDATNMTDSFGALSQLSHMEGEQRVKAFEAFREKWKGDMLTFTKYIACVASSTAPGTLDRVKALLQDPVFNIRVPNMSRMLVTMFSQNYTQFHKKDGSGYAFITDMLLKLDAINPTIASRVTDGIKLYQKLDPVRKEAMGRELQRMIETGKLSQNLYEVVSLCMKKG